MYVGRCTDSRSDIGVWLITLRRLWLRLPTGTPYLPLYPPKVSLGPPQGIPGISQLHTGTPYLPLDLDKCLTPEAHNWSDLKCRV